MAFIVLVKLVYTLEVFDVAMIPDAPQWDNTVKTDIALSSYQQWQWWFPTWLVYGCMVAAGASIVLGIQGRDRGHVTDTPWSTSPQLWQVTVQIVCTQWVF